MAITNADGSIVLTTKVDESGIADFFKKTKTELGGIGKQTKENTKSTEDFGKKSKESSEKSKKGFEGLKETLKGIGSALAAAFAVQKTIQFSNEAGQLATQTEASVQRLVDIYGSASDSVGDFIDANARALGMSKAAAASFSSVYGNLFSVWADQATNAELTNKYLNMTAVVASKTGRTVQDVQERIRSGLLGNTEAIEDLGVFVNIKTIEITDAFQRMAGGKSWEQLDAYTQQQIRSMAILEQATAKYGDEVADTSATMRNRFNAAYQDFHNSWGNIVNTVLLPVLEITTQIFDVATKGLNVLSGVSGQILEKVELQEETTDKTAENIEEQTDAQKELNKEIKKSLAGFDEIQILSNNMAEDDSKNQYDSAILNMDQTVEGENFSNEPNKELALMMMAIGGALAAVGLLLIYFGQIAWGIGFIIAGASIFSVSAAAVKDSAPDFLVNAVTKIIEFFKSNIFAGVGIILLGFLCLLSPATVPIGIGLIASGISSAGFMMLVPKWDFLANKIKEVWGKVKDVWKDDVKPSLDVVEKEWDALYQEHFKPVIDWIVQYIVPPLKQFAVILLKKILSNAFDDVAQKIDLFGTAIKVFFQMFAFTLNAFNEQITFWKNTFVGAINLIIDGINLLIGSLNKLNIKFPKIGSFQGFEIGFDIPKIPKLAQGTVIPPNREFLAVLGDNKREHEIVSPVSSMKQAFMEAMVEMGGAGHTTKEEHYYLDEAELMRIVYKLSQGGERIYGNSLLEAH